MSDASDTMRDTLKSHGLRYSRPRAAILSFMQERDVHINAEGLHAALKERGEDLSLSTIYLNLNVLKDAGLVRELRGISGEVIYDSNTREPHYHLVCHKSGKVIDIPAIEIDGVPLGRFLKESIENATGWQVDELDVHLRGVAPSER